jgi:hypothetical protein
MFQVFRVNVILNGVPQQPVAMSVVNLPVPADAATEIQNDIEWLLNKN